MSNTQPKKKIITRQRKLIILSTRSPLNFNPRAALAIAEQASEYGWDLLDLRYTGGSIPRHVKPAGALIEWLPTEPMARLLRKMNCPTVRMGKLPHPNDELLPCVLPDALAIGRLAAEHFAERQFQHLAFIGRRPWSMSKTMYETFRESAIELGCVCHLQRYVGEGLEDPRAKYERRAEQTGQWLANLPRPVGLYAFSPSEGATLYTMCEKAGLSVPEDVAILCRGNNAVECEMAPVSLSAIDEAPDEWGRQSALLLHRLMNGEPAPDSPVMIQPRGIITRHSTDVLAVKDESVSRAMRFMWDHLEQDLSVDDIASAVATPRRQLERSFRKDLKRGINAELRRKRLERCCELLRSTDLTIADLAAKIGFRSSDYLHASFKQAYKMTPRQYRLS